MKELSNAYVCIYMYVIYVCYVCTQGKEMKELSNAAAQLEAFKQRTAEAEKKCEEIKSAYAEVCVYEWVGGWVGG